MINYSICIMSAKPGTKKADISAETGGTKAYGSAQANAKLTYDQFVQHMADHNTPFSKGTISGVITDMIRCLREQLLAGNIVSLGELGSFRTSAGILARTSATSATRLSSSSFPLARCRTTPSKSSRTRILFRVSSKSPTLNNSKLLNSKFKKKTTSFWRKQKPRKPSDCAACCAFAFS